MNWLEELLWLVVIGLDFLLTMTPEMRIRVIEKLRETTVLHQRGAKE